MSDRGSLLHVGCGGDPLPHWLSDYVEVRLDVDPIHNPDIVASMLDMGDIGPFDAVFCHHALEHVKPHEVQVALSEFYRVLSPGGAVLLFVPDLEDVKATDEPLFESPAGPICGLDLIYGHRKMMIDNPNMAHKTGFISKTLYEAMTQAGFQKSAVSRLDNYALFGAGIK
jgi:predicted SAM-dependent methyltransferase